VLAVGIAVLLISLAGAGVGAATAARHQAQAAADLGALAGAARVLEGEEAACARASHIVALNGARLAGCVVHGMEILVTTEVVASIPGGPRIATARARAGPIGWAP